MKIKIKLLGKYYEFEGGTMQELLDNVKLPVVKGGGVLEITDGEKVKIKILNSMTMRGLFGQASRSGKEVDLKRFNQLFT